MTRNLAWLLVLVAGAVQAAIGCTDLDRTPPTSAGDDIYYVTKAQEIAETGSLPGPTPDGHVDIPGQRAWRDFRPPGYPVFLRAIGVTLDSYPDSVVTLWVVQMMLVASVLAWAARELMRTWTSWRRRCLAALALGFAPWWGFVAHRAFADTVTAALVTSGLLLLATFDADGEPRRRMARLVGAGLAFGAALSMRPEIIASGPLLIVVAVGLRAVRQGWRSTARDMAVAMAGVLVFVGANFAYRSTAWNEHRVFGRLDSVNPGLMAWVNTWARTEREAKNAFYEVAWGEAWAEDLPSHAFASDAEYQRVSRLNREISLIPAAVRSETVLPRRLDDDFADLASERVRSAPWSHGVAIRGHRVLNLWIEFRSSHAWKTTMSWLPPRLRAAVTWGLLLARMGVFALALIVPWVLWTRARGRPWSTAERLVLLCWVYAAIRTGLFAVLMGTFESRYAVAAWPAALLCSAWAAFDPGNDEGGSTDAGDSAAPATSSPVPSS